MSPVRIVHPRRLAGAVRISGSKNAALPLLAASLLASGRQTFSRCPRIADTDTLLAAIRASGARTLRAGDRVVVHSATLKSARLAGLDKTIRGTLLLLAPLLVRCGEAEVDLPGGCEIGTRPIDAHIRGLRALGAEVDVLDDRIRATASTGLAGTDFRLPFPSVTATELLMTAAAGARGITRLTNCAREPEIRALADYLSALGATIHGAGTSTITIDGQRLEPSRPVEFAIPLDRIEAATWAIAAATTRGQLSIFGAPADELRPVIGMLRMAGVDVDVHCDHIAVSGRATRAFTIRTGPWPRFPTDCQPLASVLAAVTPGDSIILETLFESRHKHLPELRKMGAHVSDCGGRFSFRGRTRLHGTDVTAHDLRGGAALLIAALSADGPTRIHDVEHIERGYEDIWEKLNYLGASTYEVSTDEETSETYATGPA